MIDLRSDTVTIPSPAMRKAMAAALVGDDGFAEDPTVRRLESLSAAMMGMVGNPALTVIAAEVNERLERVLTRIAEVKT